MRSKADGRFSSSPAARERESRLSSASYARFPEKQSVVLAPTGVAALNAGGQTIHSFCKLPPRLVTPQDVRKQKETALFEKLDLVVIDEISMVRADVLDGVDAFLRINRGMHVLFGGV